MQNTSHLAEIPKCCVGGIQQWISNLMVGLSCRSKNGKKELWHQREEELTIRLTAKTETVIDRCCLFLSCRAACLWCWCLTLRRTLRWILSASRCWWSSWMFSSASNQSQNNPVRYEAQGRFLKTLVRRSFKSLSKKKDAQAKVILSAFLGMFFSVLLIHFYLQMFRLYFITISVKNVTINKQQGDVITAESFLVLDYYLLWTNSSSFMIPLRDWKNINNGETSVLTNEKKCYWS